MSDSVPRRQCKRRRGEECDATTQTEEDDVKSARFVERLSKKAHTEHTEPTTIVAKTDSKIQEDSDEDDLKNPGRSIFSSDPSLCDETRWTAFGILSIPFGFWIRSGESVVDLSERQEPNTPAPPMLAAPTPPSSPVRLTSNTP